MLPKVDGLSLITQSRKKSVNTPFIILSAKRSVDDRVKGLQAGGDDYLTKPFSFSELLARIQALVRRATKTAGPTHLEVGDLNLDLLSREVRRDGRKIDLHAHEFTLLELLMRNQGHVMSKTLILEHVWDYDFDPQTNVVDVLICRLRSNKVDKNSDSKIDDPHAAGRRLCSQAFLSARAARIGVQLTLWYLAIFIFSSIVIFGLTYVLLQSNLKKSDRDFVQDRIQEYGDKFKKSGFDQMLAEIRSGNAIGRRGCCFSCASPTRTTTRSSREQLEELGTIQSR